MSTPLSPFLAILKNRINLQDVPFSERGSRLIIFGADNFLSIRLAERWLKQAGQLAAYRERPPIIDHWCFTDGAGVCLGVDMASYPHYLEFSTSSGKFKLTFIDLETLLVALPPGQCGITFQANVDKAQTDRRGGVLRLTGDVRRNIAYTTNARILRNEIDSHGTTMQKVSLLFDTGPGASLLLNITPRLGFNRYIPDPEAAIEAAAQRWHNWFALAPPVRDAYRAQYYFAWWVMRAGLISPRFFITREAMTPSKILYVGVWQWDAYFHALAYRYVDMHLAQDQLRLVLDHQREDGMIPDAVHDEGIVTHISFPIEGDVTKPPLIAWTTWKLYEHHPDVEFLNEIYENLVRNTNWWFDKNDLDHNGLCEYLHPYSSGLDDSPLWDEGLPVESPDLNTYLFLELEALAKIANVIGEPKAARNWSQHANDLARRMIRQTWDAKAGLFWARKNGQRINVRTPFNLFPLITGRMTPDIIDRLVANLTDERQFWPRFPVPTVALDDPKFSPYEMWRGPTWVNVNYLLIEGLLRSGRPDLAHELRQRTLEMICGHKDIYEYYNPNSGENPPKAASIFGWSSAILIDLAIQDAKDAS